MRGSRGRLAALALVAMLLAGCQGAPAAGSEAHIVVSLSLIGALGLVLTLFYRPLLAITLNEELPARDPVVAAALMSRASTRLRSRA